MFISIYTYRSLKSYFQSSGLILTPDEIYDSYVDFDEHLELDTSVYNTLIQKASC